MIVQEIRVAVGSELIVGALVVWPRGTDEPTKTRISRVRWPRPELNQLTFESCPSSQDREKFVQLRAERLGDLPHAAAVVDKLPHLAFLSVQLEG